MIWFRFNSLLLIVLTSLLDPTEIPSLPAFLLPSFFGMMSHRERRNGSVLSHPPPYHAATQNLHGEQIVYSNPGTRIPVSALSRRRSNVKRGEDKKCVVTRVPGYPDTRIPVSALPAADQTLKGEKIVCGNPGTRVPKYSCLAGTGVPVPVPATPPPPTRSAGIRFLILRPGCNSTIAISRCCKLYFACPDSENI